MSQVLDRTMRVLAAVALSGAVVAMTPVHTAMAQQVQIAQTTPPAAPAPSAAKPATPKKPKMAPADRIEARIKSLHDQLKITEAQAPQWNAVAQVMRDNATAMHAQMEERRQNRGKLSAVADLQDYRQVAQAHVDQIDKLIPAFQALYDTMSDAQKKNADAVFGNFGHHRDRHHHR
jgi:periplasmic protein CpxP/Spy